MEKLLYTWIQYQSRRRIFVSLAIIKNNSGKERLLMYFSGIRKKIIETGKYSPKQIFDMDENVLWLKKIPTGTYISQKKKFV